jgi:translation initiation factor IF-1
VAPRRRGATRIHWFDDLQEDLIATEAKIEMDGEVLEALGGGMFRVKLDNDHELIAYTAGKMRRYRIRMAPGDRISVQVSTYDLSRGRIVYRHR